MAAFRPISSARLWPGLFLLAWSAAAQPAQAPETLPLLEAPGARDLTSEEVLAEPPLFRFPPGERVVFAVSYLGIPVGEVSMEVARVFAWQGRRVAHLIGTARTNAFFSALFRIDDRHEALLDIDRFRTLQTATRTRHGRRREVYEEVAFDWETHFVHVLEDKRWKRTREFSLDFGPDVYDTFDVVYAVRTMPLADGARLEAPVYASFKIYGLEIAVQGEERLATTALGPVAALRLAPSNTLDGKPQGDGQGEVWLARSGLRVPLRVVGWMRPYTGFRIAAIRGELSRYDPGDPGWGALEPATLPPRVGVAPSENGKPSWRVPRSVREARRRLGIDSVDARHTGERLEEIAACGELPMLGRYWVRPGEPGVPVVGCPGRHAQVPQSRPVGMAPGSSGGHSDPPKAP